MTFTFSLHDYILNSYFFFFRAYSSAVQDDLWESLTEAARKKGRMLEGGKPSSVKEVMDTWTLQEGFPVLTVIRNYETQSANLSQVKGFILFFHSFIIINKIKTKTIYLRSDAFDTW